MAVDLETRRKRARDQFRNHVKHQGWVQGRTHSPPFTSVKFHRFRGGAALSDEAYERAAAKIDLPPENTEIKEPISMQTPGGTQYQMPNPIANPQTLDFSDVRKFLTSPLPKGIVFQCYVMRNKKGAMGSMNPIFELYAERTKQFLCASKRKSGSKASNYSLSLHKKIFEKDQNFLGKLRSNLMGTEFMIWEGHEGQTKSGEKLETGVVVYEPNFSPLNKAPRQMVVVLPQIQADGLLK
eukprot:g20821.t1